MEVFVKLNPDGSLPIAADGWFSSWGSWQACSKACAGGTRKRSKTYTPPINGGLEFFLTDGSLEEESCNTQNCPVDGTWNQWGSWCCSTCCGAGGVGTRSRSCKPPRYGGKDLCVGPDEETGQACNEQKTCSSGALSSAFIQGNELGDIDVDGTSLDGWSHTLSTCVQVLSDPGFPGLSLCDSDRVY